MTLILGHRGARGEYPENTLGGFAHTNHLVEEGISGIEFDVQLTKDGKLAVFHDDNLQRCAGRGLRVEQTSMACLQNMPQTKLFNDFNKKHGMHFFSETISELEAVLPYLDGYNHIELEIKTHVRTDLQQLADVVATYIDKLALVHFPITLTSFDTPLLFLLNQKKLALPLGLLIEGTTISATELVCMTKRLGCVQAGLHYPLITPEIIATLHAHKLKLSAWTVNDLVEKEKLVNWGVDTIITDVPTAFLAEK